MSGKVLDTDLPFALNSAGSNGITIPEWWWNFQIYIRASSCTTWKSGWWTRRWLPWPHAIHVSPGRIIDCVRRGGGPLGGIFKGPRCIPVIPGLGGGPGRPSEMFVLLLPPIILRINAPGPKEA